MKNKVSPAVVRRLPKYFYYLQTLEKDGVEKISSKQLSEITGFTASQIRQDLNHFGGFGQQGYGYRVSELKNSIYEIIGLNNSFNVVIVGYGRIGQALYNYSGFETNEFNIIGVFDLKEKEIDGVKVKSVDKLEDFLNSNDVDILVLTVPKEAAQDVVDMVEGKNIKGIWNFVPQSLDIKSNIPIENIQISDSLYTLIYYMGNPDQYEG
ncbi:redox-sensing transcriptional repressor Rex [uncultured Helcococcus sp.]|uniref:redox-sensing transcriptional repressor Rex n=1 Tax=uncultured Helcococcus sp. TaxID=1072508 RepID=UPI00261C02F5|nr:redox-sensing transcriptional repressor Rex [uncultured Helcococcus sp.]